MENGMAEAGVMPLTGVSLEGAEGDGPSRKAVLGRMPMASTRASAFMARRLVSETAARAAGCDVVSVTAAMDDKAHYYPGAGLFAQAGRPVWRLATMAQSPQA